MSFIFDLWWTTKKSQSINYVAYNKSVIYEMDVKTTHSIDIEYNSLKSLSN